MQLASPTQHENGPMQLNVMNDVVKLTLLSEVSCHLRLELSEVTCSLSHKTMFGLVNKVDLHVIINIHTRSGQNLSVESMCIIWSCSQHAVALAFHCRMR